MVNRLAVYHHAEFSRLSGSAHNQGEEDDCDGSRWTVQTSRDGSELSAVEVMGDVSNPSSTLRSGRWLTLDADTTVIVNSVTVIWMALRWRLHLAVRVRRAALPGARGEIWQIEPTV